MKPITTDTNLITNLNQCPLTAQFCSYTLKAALTYAEAQMRIDDPSMTDAVTKSLRNLNKLAKILKKKRMEKG